MCLATHLDSPLNNAILLECLNHIRYKTKKYRNWIIKTQTNELEMLLRASMTPTSCSNHHPQQYIKALYNLGETNTDPGAHDFEDLLSDARFLTALNIGKLQIQEFNRWELESLIKTKLTSTTHPGLTALYRLRCFFEQGVVLTAKPKQVSRNADLAAWKHWSCIDKDGTPVYFGKFDYLKIWLTSNFMVLKIPGQLSCLATREHFLMLSDVISQRFLINTACILAQILEKSNYPPISLVLKVYDWGDSLMELLPNGEIKRIYMWESLIIGALLSTTQDAVVDCRVFYDAMLLDFITTPVDVIRPILIEAQEKFLSIMEEATVSHHWMMQIFGLYRIWGHPTINGLDSIRAMKKHSCLVRPMNYSQIDEITWKFREMFCTAYYKKHRTWPKNTIIDPTKQSLVATCLTRGTELDLRSPLYHLEDWENVQFEKTFDVPEKFEISEMIADKATSHGFKQLKHHIIKDGTIGPGWSRSVVVRHLQENYNNPTIFLNDIGTNGFGEDEIVAGVHPKEREGNPLARLFGMMTLRKRLYIVITEALIADNVLPYFPSITMTCDAKTLMRKIHTNTKVQSENFKAKSKKVTITVNLDFAKWNSNMRSPETLGLFQDLDRLFGFDNVFTRSHEMFFPCKFYLADGTYTPTISEDGQTLLEDEGCWSDHLGGLEGLRQKGWTLWTVVVLTQIAEERGIKFKLMGQGDNQVIMCEYPLEWGAEVIRDCHLGFLSDLRSRLDKVGPPLKPSETWSSSQFFIYGKYPVFKGSPCSMSLKKICRTNRLTNEGLQNLESSLSSIAANAAAATLSDFDPIVPFFIAQMEGSGCFKLHLNHSFFGAPLSKLRAGGFFRVPKQGQSMRIPYTIPIGYRKSIKTLDSSFRRSLLLFPSSLGGYPSIQFCDLMLHGFPDPVSISIWNLTTIYKELNDGEDYYRDLIQRFLSPLINPDKNPDLLFSDPVSLNLLRPSSGSEKIKRMVLEYLSTSGLVKNQMFVEFLRIAQQSQNPLSQLLFSMRPLNPRVGSSILDATVIGRAAIIVGKVNKTSTLINLMKTNHDKPSQALRDLEEDMTIGEYDYRPRLQFYQVFYSFEENFFKSIINALFSPVGDRLNIMTLCSVEHAMLLRKRSWGHHLTGVTTAVPFEAFKWWPCETGVCNLDKHPISSDGFLWLRSALTNQTEMKECLSISKVGPFSPFFGSKTRSKVLLENNVVQKSCPNLVRATGKLLSIIGWAVLPESNLAKVITKIHESVTDLPAGCFRLSEQKKLSAIDHRWDDSKTSHEGSISIMYSALTWVNCVTNFYRPERTQPDVTTDNFNISYQAVFSAIYFLFSSWSSIGKKQFSTAYHGHPSGCPCIKPVCEDKIDLGPLPVDWEQIEVFKQHKENPYCWVPKESIITKRIESIFGGIRLPHSEDEDLVTPVTLGILTCTWLFDRNPITPMNNMLEDDLAETQTIIPINIAKVVDSIVLLKGIVLTRLILYFFINSTSKKYGPGVSPENWLKEAVGSLELTPLRWFVPLHSIFLNSDSISRLVDTFPGLIPPLGVPPSPTAKSKFLHQAFLRVSQKFEDITYFCDELKLLLQSPVYSTITLYHPYILYLMLKALDPTSRLNHSWLSQLALLRKTLMSLKPELEIATDTDLIPSLIELKVESDIDNLLLIQLIDNLIIYRDTSNVILWKGHPETAAKILSLSIKTQSVKMQDQLTPSVVQSLPKTCTRLLKSSAPPSSKGCPGRLNVIEFIPQTKTLRNHFLKASTLITGSCYKLLSVLQYVLSQSTLNQTPREILMAGDGVGGNSVTLRRLFPDANIVYNSLFDISELSSIGIDNFSPAYMTLYASQESRGFSGIETVMSAPSDLTLIETTNILGKLSSKYSWILCDAEGRDWETPHKQIKISENLSLLASVSKTRLLLIKSYALRLDFLYLQFLTLCSYWKKVEVLRSTFSSVGSTEVYLLCTGVNEGLIPRLEWAYLNPPGKCEIRSQCYDTNHYIRFVTSITKNPDFYGDCGGTVNLMNRYVEAPHLRDWKLQKIRTICSKYTSLEPSRVPIDAIYHKRRCVAPMELLDTFKTNLKPSHLSFSVLRSILLDTLKFFGCVVLKDPLALTAFETLLKTGRLWCYQSIDRSWAWTINADSSWMIDSVGREFKFADLCTKAFTSSLVREMSSFTDLDPSVIVFYFDWKKEFRSIMAHTQHNWWEHKDKGWYPPHMTPLRLHQITKQPISLILSRPRSRPNTKLMRDLGVTETDNLDLLTLVESQDMEDQSEQKRLIHHKLPIIINKDSLILSSIIRSLQEGPGAAS